MTDRLRCVALVILVGCALTSAAEAANPSPSFAVRVEGRGPAMILIPGFLSSGAVWDDVLAHYRSRYTCHVLTLPGLAGRPPIAAPILPRVRDEIIHFGWLPRILRRRFEAEMHEDPDGALMRRHRERRTAIIGWTLGLTLGTLGLLLGMWF